MIEWLFLGYVSAFTLKKYVIIAIDSSASTAYPIARGDPLNSKLNIA